MIVGPLGWAYPLLNALIEVLQVARGRGQILNKSRSEPLLSNLEEITWTDWKGRERKMTIHREVK
jgi:hypothetical protein